MSAKKPCEKGVLLTNLPKSCDFSKMRFLIQLALYNSIKTWLTS